MIDNKAVGQAIAKLRQADNMTQQTLAACLNVSHQAVSKWEKGMTLPDVLTLLELSRMFGVTLEQLLAGDVDHRIEARNAEAARVEKPIELKLDYTDIKAKAEKAIEDAEFAKEEAAAASEASDEEIDLDKVIEMAPFMSRAALDDIAMKYNGKCNPRQLAKLAPFLSKDCLEKLVLNCESEVNWDSLRRLAPFLRKETVDALTAAAAKGEKYTNELGKQIKHGIKKVYNIGDQIYHEAIKPALKKAIKPERAAEEKQPEPAPAVSKVSAARIRIFERALTEEKFDWIGEHIDQLEDVELKKKIATRAFELGMNDWLDEYMTDYCDQNSIDDAILSGNWDYIAANIEFADDDALALIADTAAAEGKWDWLSKNLEFICENDDARAAIIGHALKTGDLTWLGENIYELSLTEEDSEVIAAYVIARTDKWDWLEAHINELEGNWAYIECAENAYKAGYKDLATVIIDEHLEDEDLGALITAAIEAGDLEFASNIIEYNAGDNGALCIELAKNGHLKEAVELAENIDDDAITELLDIATEQGDWDSINLLNDMLE
ncbi:MAG: helix-turn-helix transcriptional regulator [Clostridia bacterium]|nr:helix-turn-helix transcriptional regulator [Clostridia bacterium]